MVGSELRLPHKEDITVNVKTPAAAAVAVRLLRDILMQKSTAFHDGDRLRDGGAVEIRSLRRKKVYSGRYGEYVPFLYVT